jgi:hypothetical protein
VSKIAQQNPEFAASVRKVVITRTCWSSLELTKFGS